jgi:hypothetical protein
MIRVGDKVVPYFNMVQVGVVIEIETVQSKLLTTGGTSSGVRIASIMLDAPGKQIIKCKTEDLLHADR